METVQELKPVELSRIAQINKTTLNRILQKEQDQLSVINNRIRGISPELVEEILKEKHPHCYLPPNGHHFLAKNSHPWSPVRNWLFSPAVTG